MADKREFTGVFIPAHIWTSKELIPSEKMLLGEIDCLSKSRGYCDASRAHFAEWLSCTVQNVTYYFNRLEKLGFIRIDKTPGFRSKIRLNKERFYVEQPDGGGKRDLRVGVNGTDGGSKRDLPEIQEERQVEIQEDNVSENADALSFQVDIYEKRTEVVTVKGKPTLGEVVQVFAQAGVSPTTLEAERSEEKPSPTVPAAKPKRDNNDPREYLNYMIGLEREAYAAFKNHPDKERLRKPITERAEKILAEIKLEYAIDAVVNRLNEKGKFPRGYKTDKKETRTAIRKRLKEYSLEDLFLVVDFKCREWKDDAKCRQWLRPDTLFNGHFEAYLNAALLDKQNPITNEPAKQVYRASEAPQSTVQPAFVE